MRRKSRGILPSFFGPEVAELVNSSILVSRVNKTSLIPRSAVSNKGTITRKEKNMLKALRSSKGFTLIELLIVVAVIAIPQFMAYRQKAYNSSATSDLRNLKTGMEAFQADNQQYPDTLTAP